MSASEPGDYFLKRHRAAARVVVLLVTFHPAGGPETGAGAVKKIAASVAALATTTMLRLPKAASVSR